MQKLRKARPYALIIAFVVAAALTPPDPLSQTVMAVPMYLLYEGGILFASIMLKAKARAEAELMLAAITLAWYRHLAGNIGPQRSA